jgi:hypothetical protein
LHDDLFLRNVIAGFILIEYTQFSWNPFSSKRTHICPHKSMKRNIWKYTLNYWIRKGKVGSDTLSVYHLVFLKITSCYLWQIRKCACDYHHSLKYYRWEEYIEFSGRCIGGGSNERLYPTAFAKTKRYFNIRSFHIYVGNQWAPAS